MTNEQLAVLLDSLAEELSAAILIARQRIADTRPRVPTRVHIGESCMNLFSSCNNPEHWEIHDHPDPVDELRMLDMLSDQLQERVDRLSPRPS